MGLRPTQVDEKPLLRFTHELVISTEAKRSGEICGSFSGERMCFSTERTRISYFAALHNGHACDSP
jgi:hypothetical protein